MGTAPRIDLNHRGSSPGARRAAYALRGCRGVELALVPAREPARRREAEQRRDLGQRSLAVPQVAIDELAPHGVDDARSSVSPSLASWRWIVRRSTPRCCATSRSCTARCRAVSRSARGPAALMSRPVRVVGARLEKLARVARHLADRRRDSGDSRSARAQTMPLKSWPNSTLRPNTRSCTERSAGASCAKHTRSGRQPGPSSVRSIRNTTPIASSVDWRTGPRVPDDQLLAQHDDVAALLEREEQRFVEPPAVARERVDREPQRRLLAHEQPDRPEVRQPSRLGHQQAERLDAAALGRCLEQLPHRIDRDLELGLAQAARAAARTRAAVRAGSSPALRATSA